MSTLNVGVKKWQNSLHVVFGENQSTNFKKFLGKVGLQLSCWIEYSRSFLEWKPFGILRFACQMPEKLKSLCLMVTKVTNGFLVLVK